MELFTRAPRAEDCKRLDRDFFARDGITVARELLGKILVHETPLGPIRGIITETESYMGEEDKGSHTYGGKRTPRTEPMYHAGGTSYVYLIYGMYSCMNIAAMREDISQAVLLRKAEPADDLSRERMERLRTQRLRGRGKSAGKAFDGASAGRACASGDNRGSAEKVPEDGQGTTRIPASVRKHLADGPGKLCIAMGITRADNDIDMTASPCFYVTEGILVDPGQIRAGKRIGIDYAEEAADYLWRFYL